MSLWSSLEMATSVSILTSSHALAAKYFDKYEWIKDSNHDDDEKEGKVTSAMFFNLAADEAENPLE